MHDESQQELFAYYNERAREYDDVYLGKGPAIPHQHLYKKDAAKINNIISSFGRGHIIDIGCGTGYWLPRYARNCDDITLIDVSEKVIAECRNRSNKLGITNKCHYVKGDFFELDFKDHIFDSVVVGFLVSHLRKKTEKAFFEKIRRITMTGAQVFIIDGLWNKLRQQYRKKEGIHERLLNDGRKFRIYKRYFTKSDIEEIFKRNALRMMSFFQGHVFFAATAVINE